MGPWRGTRATFVPISFGIQLKGLSMRRISIVLAVLIAAAMTATAAFGSSVHFKKGGTPTCTISSSTDGTSISTSCTGTVAGLGGEDIKIELTTSGFAV